jgi:hypothetical protein
MQINNPVFVGGIVAVAGRIHAFDEPLLNIPRMAVPSFEHETVDIEAVAWFSFL